jgi:hypothetical protein
MAKKTSSTPPPASGDWDLLIERIKSSQCTAFLGAGASFPRIADAKTIADQIVPPELKEYGLFCKSDSLAKITQMLAIYRDESFPRDKVAKICKDAHSTNPEPCNIHKTLAKLPINFYITTNYDDYILEALKQENKTPKDIICPWSSTKKVKTSKTTHLPCPSPTQPYVYYLHGSYRNPATMVLTEDDYLTFLGWIKSDLSRVPATLHGAFAANSLVFIGYGLGDWDFRVLVRSIIDTASRNTGKMSISVQLPPDEMTDTNASFIQQHLEKYLSSLIKVNIKLFWMSADEFAKELEYRWEN